MTKKRSGKTPRRTRRPTPQSPPAPPAEESAVAEAPAIPPLPPVVWLSEPVDTPPAPKKRAILVDGLSFYHHHNRRSLNWGQINWTTLSQILVREIGEGEATDLPTYTVHPNLEANIQKSVGAAGFRVEPVDPKFEGDDRFLIEKIRNLDPNEIGSLVLATYDGSFVDAAREAKARGIKVVWVASVHAADHAGRPSMGIETQEVVKNEFEFVDLKDSGVADRVRRREWEDRSQGFQVPRREEKMITISFEAKVSPRDHTLFMTMVQSTLDRFNIKITTIS